MADSTYSRILPWTPPKDFKDDCSYCYDGDKTIPWIRVEHIDAKTQQRYYHCFHRACLHQWVFKNGVSKELITHQKTLEDLKDSPNMTCPECRGPLYVYDLITLKDKVITWFRYITWEKMQGLLLFLAGVGMVFISLKGKAYFPPYDKNMLAFAKAGLVIGSGMIIDGFSYIFGPRIIERIGQAITLSGTTWAVYILAKEMFLF